MSGLVNVSRDNVNILVRLAMARRKHIVILRILLISVSARAQRSLQLAKIDIGMCNSVDKS